MPYVPNLLQEVCFLVIVSIDQWAYVPGLSVGANVLIKLNVRFPCVTIIVTQRLLRAGLGKN